MRMSDDHKLRITIILVAKNNNIFMLRSNHTHTHTENGFSQDQKT